MINWLWCGRYLAPRDSTFLPNMMRLRGWALPFTILAVARWYLARFPNQIWKQKQMGRGTWLGDARLQKGWKGGEFRSVGSSTVIWNDSLTQGSNGKKGKALPPSEGVVLTHSCAIFLFYLVGQLTRVVPVTSLKTWKWWWPYHYGGAVVEIKGRIIRCLSRASQIGCSVRLSSPCIIIRSVHKNLLLGISKNARQIYVTF